MVHETHYHDSRWRVIKLQHSRGQEAERRAIMDPALNFIIRSTQQAAFREPACDALGVLRPERSPADVFAERILQPRRLRGARIAPKLAITIDSAMGIIRVADNGPGIPPETVTSILDFTTRTSSREAYASPTRGAQGNGLRCIALPEKSHSGRRSRMPRKRKLTSSVRSRLRAHSMPSPGNSAPQRAWPVSGAIRASGMRLAIWSLRSTAGSPKALTRARPEGGQILAR
jgi:hypothetical protein